MFDFQIDKETKELMRKFVKELGILNEHLSDMKEMIAPKLGFKITENKGIDKKISVEMEE